MTCLLESLGAFRSAFDTEEQRRTLPTILRILAQRFPDDGGIPDRIEQVVPDLKRQPQIVREPKKVAAFLRSAFTQHRRGFNRISDQRARLARLTLKSMAGGGTIGRVKVHHLSAGQPILPQRTGQGEDQPGTHFPVWMSIRARYDLECECEKRVACQDRGRFVELAMQAWPTTAQIVVVHAWQVVMYQRLGMNALDGGRDTQRLIRSGTNGVAGRQHEQCPEAFARAKHGVSHRFRQAGIAVQPSPDRLINRSLDVRFPAAQSKAARRIQVGYGGTEERRGRAGHDAPFECKMPIASPPPNVSLGTGCIARSEAPRQNAPNAGSFLTARQL